MENDLKIEFFELGKIDESLFTRVVVVCRYGQKFVYVRQKGRESWEIPGGKIELNETWQSAARRELFEETGAKEFKLEPICGYKISKPALLLFAEIEVFGQKPDSEIEEVGFFNEPPKNLTYADSHTKMFEKVKKFTVFY